MSVTAVYQRRSQKSIKEVCQAHAESAKAETVGRGEINVGSSVLIVGQIEQDMDMADDQSAQCT